MDWISFSTSAAAELITAQRRGEPMADRIAKHNRDFAVSHRSWFEALYKDKYEYMAEWDLMSMAFRLDLGLYYLGVVAPVYKYGERALFTPPFSPSRSRSAFYLIRAYNRRFAKIASARRRRNALGKTNRGNRCLIPSFTLSRGDIRRLFKPLRQWLWLELTEGWRSWGDPPPEQISVAPPPRPQPAATPEAAVAEPV
jgi:hypothetical protein